MTQPFTDLTLAAEIERPQVATSLVFTEGPAYDADGSLYFSDIENNRILRLDAAGQRTVSKGSTASIWTER